MRDIGLTAPRITLVGAERQHGITQKRRAGSHSPSSQRAQFKLGTAYVGIPADGAPDDLRLTERSRAVVGRLCFPTVPTWENTTVIRIRNDARFTANSQRGSRPGISAALALFGFRAI